jgi:hypothetical protein
LISRYIKQEWISDAWTALGGGKIVDIRRVDLHRVSSYLSKYLSKEMLLAAPPRARRVTTSRSIKLLKKQSNEYEWALLRAPIRRLVDICRIRVINVKNDTDGNLVAFETFQESGP